MRLNENSMLYWYPKIKDVLATPKTVFVRIPCNHEIIDHVSSELVEKLYRGADKIGYPLFIRTDQASNKHDFKNSCKVESQDQLIRHIQNTLEFNAMAGIMGLSWNAISFREFLELESVFMAFNEMPVAKERRYFVKHGSVECHHPYWPVGAIKEDFDQREKLAKWADKPANIPENWKAKLEEINFEDTAEVQYLWKQALIFSNKVPGEWSVDFAKTREGKWYMIDAAVFKESYHDPLCPNCPADIRVIYASDEKQKEKPLSFE